MAPACTCPLFDEFGINPELVETDPFGRQTLQMYCINEKTTNPEREKIN